MDLFYPTFVESDLFNPIFKTSHNHLDNCKKLIDKRCFWEYFFTLIISFCQKFRVNVPTSGVNVLWGGFVTRRNFRGAKVLQPHEIMALKNVLQCLQCHLRVFIYYLRIRTFVMIFITHLIKSSICPQRCI